MTNQVIGVGFATIKTDVCLYLGNQILIPKVSGFLSSNFPCFIITHSYLNKFNLSLCYVTNMLDTLGDKNDV